MIIWIITGFWILVGAAEAAHLITIMTNRSLQTYITLSSVFILAGLFAYIGMLTFLYYKKKLVIDRQTKPEVSAGMLVFGCLAAITVYKLWHGTMPDLEDAVYDIVIGNIKNGTIMTVHPFTGEFTESTMPFRMQILGLSSLYSALITESQQSQYTIMCKIVPIIIWVLGMMLYWLFAQKLFAFSVNKRWIFMCAIAVVMLFTANSPGLPGYRLFHAGFSGETIRAVLLLPYALYVGWQKNWFLAVVAILCEMIFVWTTYGVGYCVLITVVLFAVHHFMNWRAKHGT